MCVCSLLFCHLSECRIKEMSFQLEFWRIFKILSKNLYKVLWILVIFLVNYEICNITLDKEDCPLALARAYQTQSKLKVAIWISRRRCTWHHCYQDHWRQDFEPIIGRYWVEGFIHKGYWINVQKFWLTDCNKSCLECSEREWVLLCLKCSEQEWVLLCLKCSEQ